MKRKGLTLVELMIALTIFSIFSVFMYRFFSDEQKSLISKHRQLDMHYNALLVMDYIEGSIRNSPTIPTLNYSSSNKTLMDSQGNTISSGVESINIAADSQDSNLINITVTMSYGSGARQLQYSLKNTINVKK